MISNTSREAYTSIKPSVNLKQSIVYEIIKKYQPVANDKIAEILGWEINKITGRVNELVRLGFIEHYGYSLTKSKRRAKTWVVATAKRDLEKIYDKVSQDKV